MLFSENFDTTSAEDLQMILADKLVRANIPRMVVTLGAEGAVYAELGRGCGFCPSPRVDPIDTTGAGDAFFSGVTIGLTYGKTAFYNGTAACQSVLFPKAAFSSSSSGSVSSRLKIPVNMLLGFWTFPAAFGSVRRR